MNIQAKALQRPGAVFAALFIAFSLLVALASPAEAQVGDIVDTVEDTVDDTTDEVTDVVEDVANPNEDPAKGPVEETIDTVTEAVDEATGGATEPVTHEVREVTRENLAPVDEAVGGVTDGVLGNQVPGINGGSTEGSLDNSKVLSRTQDRPNTRVGQPATGTLDDSVGGGAVTEEVVTRPPGTEDPAAGSLIEQAGQIAREIAFPMVLLLMVAAFLAIQSRWDKKDPKLALAPLDIDEQFLSFR